MTPEQRKMARHALGLDESEQSYRNRYFAAVGGEKEFDWNAMCSLGFALRESGGGRLAHFYLTAEGARLALDPGETLDPEDFPS